jgi:hypothetical protein
MKKLILTAGAACALAALYALPSFAAGASATDSATTAATNATDANAGTNGASGSSSTDANGSAGANANANAAGTTVNAGASGSASSSMKIGDIDVKNPFGSTTVNDQQTPEAVSAALTAEQRTDLQARCNLINTNASMFAADVPAFCQSYLEYAKAHPAQ